MMRYSRRWPPPRHHIVTSPVLLRPPERCRFSVSGLYGSLGGISSKVWGVIWRRPGDGGLYLRIGISVILSMRNAKGKIQKFLNFAFFISNSSGSFQKVGHLLALAKRHVRLLPVGPASLE